MKKAKLDFGPTYTRMSVDLGGIRNVPPSSSNQVGGNRDVELVLFTRRSLHCALLALSHVLKMTQVPWNGLERLQHEGRGSL